MNIPHGSGDLSLENRVIFVDAFGPWNREAVMEFDQKLKKLYNSRLKGELWAMIARLNGVGLFTPDSIPFLRDLHQWRVSAGLRHLAIVHDKRKLSNDITEYQLRQIYEVASRGLCEERFFYNIDDARKWLQSIGY